VYIVAETVLFQPANGLNTPIEAVVPLDQSAADVAPGSSQEQKRAERAMIDALAAEIGVQLVPKSIRLSSGNRVVVDGDSASLEPTVRTARGRVWGSPA
jgi:hypothetical protein